MLNLIRYLVFGHIHTWETVREILVEHPETGNIVGRRYIQRCKCCGKLQTKTFPKFCDLVLTT